MSSLPWLLVLSHRGKIELFNDSSKRKNAGVTFLSPGSLIGNLLFGTTLQR